MTVESIDVKVHRLYRLSTATPLKAFVDILINDAILIKGIKVVEGKDGLFVSMPQEKAKDNKWYDSVRCLKKGILQQIETEVLSAYESQP